MQSVLSLGVDVYDHMSQYLRITDEYNREWAYIVSADLDIFFNFNRLRSCWQEPVQNRRLRSEYTDQNLTTEQVDYDFTSQEVMEFVQMDLMN